MSDSKRADNESYGGLGQFIAHSRRVAAGLRKQHPAPKEGYEGSLESEASFVIGRLCDELEKFAQ